ncbi:hypothetical protein Fcan01_19309 [Folsomia candida]|uniref:Uncharacterized protein n=1 Tax=Folsomia candida TaxID=158441 RepID=A0A226DK27_FOLCA|nr:hypothetical protein Fcan01_19309 [Folsomia candida]
MDRDKSKWLSDTFFPFRTHIRELYERLPLNPYFPNKVDVNLTGVDNTCFRILSAFEDITPLKALPEFLGVLLSLASHYSLDHVIPEAFKDLILWSPKHAFFPKNFSYLDGTLTFSILRRNIEREVLQCGKTVFVGKSSEITVEYEFLSRKYPDVKFFMSGESIQNYPSGISIRNGWNSRVIRGFKSVVEAGIWSYVEKVELRGKNLNRTPAFVSEKMKDDRPVNIATLKGKWPTVFVLVGCLISVSIPMFIVECSRILRKSISNVCRVNFRGLTRPKRTIVKAAA